MRKGGAGALPDRDESSVPKAISLGTANKFLMINPEIGRFLKNRFLPGLRG
jgi:hypothetical protein